MLSFSIEAADKDELIDRFLSLGLEELVGSISPADLQEVRHVLRQQIEEDPYMDSKFEWLASFLTKEREL